jgi:putative ABC transport system permease protein
MMRVALKGLAGRKLRSALTALAIVLGVAMVSGTYVLTDTFDRGFDQVYGESYARSDAVVSARPAFGDDPAETGLPAGVLDVVRRAPGVASATGTVVDEARLVGRDGEVLGGGAVAPYAFGIDPRADERLNPLDLTGGRWPRGAGEVAIDRATAEAEDLGAGDRIAVAARGPARTLTVAGVVEFGGVDSLGGATIAVFDLPTAQALFGKAGRLDTVRVAAAEGVRPEQLVGTLTAQVPRGAQVRTGEAQAETESADTSDDLGFLRPFLLAFGAIALFVGSFVIANTLSITIAQRTRELATVRTLGGSRRQVLVSVVVEALVVGVLASVVGLFAGLGLARGLNALLVGVGIDLPSGGTVLATRTIVVSLLVGTVITLVASVRPALRATRVAPIAAVREGSALPPSRFARFGLAGAAAVTALAVAALAVGVFAGGLATGSRLLAIGLGTLLLFVGLALLAPRFVRPLVTVLGWPATRIAGATGRLARANATRNPARTASTAAALMIGLALVTFVAILGQGLRSTFVDSVDELFVADYALTAEEGFAPLPPAVQDAVAAAPGVRAVSAVRSGQARIGGEDLFISAVDGSIARTIDMRWVRGSDAVPGQLGRDGVFVTRGWAEDRRLGVGSPVAIATPSGATLRLRVRGIWEEPEGGSPFGDVTVSHEAFAQGFPRARNDFTFVETDGGVTAANTAALERAVGAFPDAKLQTRDEFTDAQVASLAQLLNVLYVLLALSVIVSLFGIVNTLVLSVLERTRELGMLRAIGMTRRQVRRMVRHESIVTALLGAVLGIGTGVFLAALVTRALADDGFAFALPLGSLVLFVVAAVVVGMLAAILPARRASRLRILDALQHQ